jgi:hypothetical protein
MPAERPRRKAVREWRDDRTWYCGFVVSVIERIEGLDLLDLWERMVCN